MIQLALTATVLVVLTVGAWSADRHRIWDAIGRMVEGRAR